MLPREEAHEASNSKEKRQRNWKGMGGGMLYINPHTLGKYRYWMKGHLYTASCWAKVSFLSLRRCWMFNLTLLHIEGDWQNTIHYFTTNITLNLPSYSCNWKACPDAMCVKWRRDRKTIHIRLQKQNRNKLLFWFEWHLPSLSGPLLVDS